MLREHADVFRLGLGEHQAGRLATGPALLVRCQNGIRATLKELVAYPGLRTDVGGLAPALVEMQLRRAMVELGVQIEALGLDLKVSETAAGNLALAVERAQELRARFPNGEAAADGGFLAEIAAATEQLHRHQRQPAGDPVAHFRVDSQIAQERHVPLLSRSLWSQL